MASKTVPAGNKIPLVQGSGSLVQGIEIVDDSLQVSLAPGNGVYLFGVNCNVDLSGCPPGSYFKKITLTRNETPTGYKAVTYGMQGVPEHVAFGGTVQLAPGDRVALINDSAYTLVVNDLTFWLWSPGLG